jgi:two-component system, LuxR family, response regulator FixJ
MREETTVYVVDSDQAARESISAIARSKGVRVREFESGEALLTELPAGNPACLIVDADLPGVSGLDLQRQLQQSGQSPPAVMVSNQGDVRTAVKAMQQGAVTFLQKPCAGEELSAAIDAALDKANQQQETKRHKQELRDRFEQLTLSEREVLSRVLEGQPNRRIANEMDIGLRTVELRRSNIMRKTGASNLTELVRLAIEVDFPNGLTAPTASEAGKSNGEPVAS